MFCIPLRDIVWQEKTLMHGNYRTTFPALTNTLHVRLGIVAVHGDDGGKSHADVKLMLFW